MDIQLGPGNWSGYRTWALDRDTGITMTIEVQEDTISHCSGTLCGGKEIPGIERHAKIVHFRSPGNVRSYHYLCIPEGERYLLESLDQTLYKNWFCYVYRLDAESLIVNGYVLEATEEQENRLRSMSIKERNRFVEIVEEKVEKRRLADKLSKWLSVLQDYPGSMGPPDEKIQAMSRASGKTSACLKEFAEQARKIHNTAP